MANFLDKTGLSWLWTKIKLYIDTIAASKANASDIASESAYGLVKINPNESVTLNANGQLDVGGRLGQMQNTSGIYAPKTIAPNAVGNGSFLLTEANGTTLGSKSLSVTTGFKVNLSSAAAAGATTYSISNTYENRIKAFLAINGVAALDEASASRTVKVLSVRINNSDVKPSSAENGGTIIITTAASINPNASTSSIRIYPKQDGFSNLLVGQGVRSDANYGASVAVGQSVYSGRNACCTIGASLYNAGNGSTLLGRQHINVKNRAFLAGTGHDTTNGPSENAAAVGQWSNIRSTTLFAVGNGTSHTSRKNAFEVTSDGGIVLCSPNGTRYKLSVADNGTISTTAV